MFQITTHHIFISFKFITAPGDGKILSKHTKCVRNTFNKCDSCKYRNNNGHDKCVVVACRL